jgi:hypothetical protein
MKVLIMPRGEFVAFARRRSGSVAVSDLFSWRAENCGLSQILLIL